VLNQILLNVGNISIIFFLLFILPSVLCKSTRLLYSFFGGYLFLMKILWESANHWTRSINDLIWHARSNRFPRSYHHLTSNFKLYPISHLKPTDTYTGQLTFPSRIYCPNFSLYQAFWTEALLDEVVSNRSWKIQCSNFHFYISSSFVYFLIDKVVAVRVPKNMM
jgi:hypothetical protein